MDKSRINEICKFISNGALYSKIPVSIDEKIEINNYASNFTGLDLYCPDCGANKTFIYETHSTNGDMGKYRRNKESTVYYSNIVSIVYKCPSCGKKVFVEFLYLNDYIMKIAQYPALCEISRDELKKFQKNRLIDKEFFSEIQKADICAGESYFVAAFTYMRRVFENLIKNIFNMNQQKIGITYEEYTKKKTDQKIKLIKDYLPIDDGVYNPLFSLLSEGIHSLTEEECAENYTLLKSVLLELLVTFKAKKEQEERRKQIKDLLAERKSQSKKTTK